MNTVTGFRVLSFVFLISAVFFWMYQLSDTKTENIPSVQGWSCLICSLVAFLISSVENLATRFVR
jgi:hypothetical protein